jgi:hypothetical protein
MLQSIRAQGAFDRSRLQHAYARGIFPRFILHYIPVGLGLRKRVRLILKDMLC